jgi:hypothetical protein
MAFFKDTLKKVNFFSNENEVTEMDITNKNGDVIHIEDERKLWDKVKDGSQDISNNLYQYVSMKISDKDKFENEFEKFVEKQKKADEFDEKIKNLKKEAPVEMTVDSISTNTISVAGKTLKMFHKISPIAYLVKGVKSASQKLAWHRQFKKEFENFEYANSLSNNQINESRKYALYLYDETVTYSVTISDEILRLQNIEEPNDKDLERIKFLEGEYKKTVKTLDNTDMEFDKHIDETSEQIPLSTKDDEKVKAIRLDKQNFKDKQLEIEENMKKKMKEFLQKNKKAIEMMKVYGKPILAVGLTSLVVWKLLTLSDMGLNAADMVKDIEIGNMNFSEIATFFADEPATIDLDLDSVHDIYSDLTEWKSAEGLDVFNKETIDIFFQSHMENMDASSLEKLSQAIENAHSTDGGYQELVDILENHNDMNILNSIDIEQAEVATQNITPEVEPVATETVQDKAEPVVTETVQDKAEPVETETVQDKAEPVVTETVQDKAEPVETETVQDKAEPVETETVQDKAEPVETETVQDKPEHDIPHGADEVVEKATNTLTGLTDKNMKLRSDGFNGMLDKFHSQGQTTHNSLIETLKTHTNNDEGTLAALHDSSEKELTSMFHDGVGSKLITVNPDIGPQSVDSYLESISSAYDVPKEKLYDYIMSRSIHGNDFQGNWVNMGDIRNPLIELNTNFPMEGNEANVLFAKSSNVQAVFNNDKLFVVQEAKKVASQKADNGIFSVFS